MPLNDRESVFVDAYLCEPNATRAAVAAGYAPTYGRRVRWAFTGPPISPRSDPTFLTHRRML
jgi:hypothetical protein